MRNKLLAGVAVAVAAMLSGCGSEPKKTETKKEAVQAPPVYRVNMDTSKGTVIIEVHRDWAPLGADRFYDLVQSKFFDGARFFRVIKGFVVQFGLNGDPDVNAKWRNLRLVDDPPKMSNKRGTITYATSGPGTRTTQVFINLGNNARLDSQGFSPFGEVVEGMDVVDSFFGGYRDGPPMDSGPDQAKVEAQGNQYLEQHYPKLDYIKSAKISDVQ